MKKGQEWSRKEDIFGWVAIRRLQQWDKCVKGVQDMYEKHTTQVAELKLP